MTFKQIYTEVQINTEMISPSSGKSLFIWQIIMEASGEALVEFAPSGIDVAQLNGAGSIGISNPDCEGQIGESLTISCPANTTVKVLYDEV